MKRLIVIALLLTACSGTGGDDDGGDPAVATDHTVTGSVVLTTNWDSISVMSPNGTVTTIGNSRYETGVGDWCQGAGGYSDMSEGAQVKVSDAAGELLAFGDLQAGTITSSLGPMRRPGWECTMEFEVDSVPDVDTYQVEVASRGAVLFSRDEMKANDWKVNLSLS